MFNLPSFHIFKRRSDQIECQRQLPEDTDILEYRKHVGSGKERSQSANDRAEEGMQVLTEGIIAEQPVGHHGHHHVIGREVKLAGYAEV